MPRPVTASASAAPAIVRSTGPRYRIRSVAHGYSSDRAVITSTTAGAHTCHHAAPAIVRSTGPRYRIRSVAHGYSSDRAVITSTTAGAHTCHHAAPPPMTDGKINPTRVAEVTVATRPATTVLRNNMPARWPTVK